MARMPMNVLSIPPQFARFREIFEKAVFSRLFARLRSWDACSKVALPLTVMK